MGARRTAAEPPGSLKSIFPSPREDEPLDTQLPASLAHALHADRLAQAYLLFGPAPDRLDEVVLRFLQGVACSRSEGEPCGECTDCRGLRREAHPDLVVLPTREETDGGNPGIGVGDVRTRVLEAASLTPARSPCKLFWLRDVRRLTPEASNTLLKVLEEPSGEALFVLTARSQWDCLPTVRSRCQWVRFAPDVRRDEDPLERCRRLEPDGSFDEERIQRWNALLEGRARSRDMGWNRTRARAFLVYLLTLVHRRITEGSTALDEAAEARLSARLIPDLLSRLEELERGGRPVLAVNSLLETIFYPREFTTWAPAT